MIHYPKSREEWLRLRHPVVTSTESSALFGLSKYMTAYELAVRKRELAPPDDDENERTRAGTALQFAIARLASDERGIKVRAMNGFATLNDHRMGASYDYEIIGTTEDSPLAALYAEHGPGVLEIKNVDGWVYKNEWADGEAPAHIEVQLQHQLACCGRKWGLIAALVGGNRLEILLRHIDWPVVDKIIAKVGRFWNDLAGGILPPVVLPDDIDILSAVYAHAEPGKVLDAQARDDVAVQAFEYIEAAKAERDAKARKDTAKGKLLQLIGDHERVIGAGYTISAGTVAEAQMSYTRPAYRNFRVTAKGNKNGSKDE